MMKLSPGEMRNTWNMIVFPL